MDGLIPETFNRGQVKTHSNSQTILLRNARIQSQYFFVVEAITKLLFSDFPQTIAFNDLIDGSISNGFGGCRCRGNRLDRLL